MGEPEINAFLTPLAVKEKVSASTQNQALSALLFLYHHIIGRQVGDLGEVIRAEPTRLPVVMTREEVRAVLSNLAGGDKWLMGSLMYGAGLRLMECLHLAGYRTSISLAARFLSATTRVSRAPWTPCEEEGDACYAETI